MNKSSAAYSAEEKASVETRKPLEEKEYPTSVTIGEPSDIELIALKETYEGFPLFKTTISKSTFIYTLLTKSVDDSIVERQAKMAASRTPQQLDSYYREEVITSCVLWPTDFNTIILQQLPAGVEYSLFNKIMAASGMNEPATGDESIVVPKPTPEPTPEDISRFKADPRYQRLGLQYRKINTTIFDGGMPSYLPVGHFIYTAIERLPYNQAMTTIMQNPSVSAVEADNILMEKILKIGVVFPKEFDWDAAPAGWARLIYQGIMVLSGFSGTLGVEIEDEQLV